MIVASRGRGVLSGRVTMGNEVDKTALFKSVIDNAFDFLNRSISELETQPKYSIINFWTSIELFFKGRLLEEHWSLVFETVSIADPEALKTGGFRSTKLDETLSRLKSITALRINKDAENTFTNLRNRRNQGVHFFHAVYVKETDEKLTERIVAEQCRGWFYLHRF